MKCAPGGAIVIGFLGLGGAYLATRSSVDNLEIVHVVDLHRVDARLRDAAHLRVIKGIFTERSGVINIGIEGMMLMGDLGIWGADRTGNWVTGVLIGMAAGVAAGARARVLLHPAPRRPDPRRNGDVDPRVGIVGYAFVQLYGKENIQAGLGVPRLQLRFLERVPPDALGDLLYGAFGRLSAMIWIAFLFVIIAHVVLFKTPLGLRLRSTGEHPRAADTVGISVYGMRYFAVTLSGVLAGAGGAFISVGVISGFSENQTLERGSSPSRR